MRKIEYIEERSFWWEELQERIHKLSSDLEDAIYEHFQELHYGSDARPEDPDYPLVNNIWNMVMAMEEVIKMRRQVLDIALRQYHTFHTYWQTCYDDIEFCRLAKEKLGNYDGFTRKVVR